MTRRTRITATILCLTVVFGTASEQSLAQELPQDATSELRANPFSRPGYVLSLGTTPLVSGIEPTVPLQLRATMVSSDMALVNINGVILSTGQEYQGYRVVSIGEGRAVLSNNGERLVLNVYERQLGLDESDGIGQRQ